MSNPFATFRKNRNVWMAGLVLLALLAFVIAPAIETMSQGFRGSAANPVAVRWDGGKLTMLDLRNAMQTHGRLVSFLSSVAKKVLERGGQPRVPGFEFDPQSGQILSLGVQGAANEVSILHTRILAAHARSMGVEFSDASADDFLLQYFDNKLSDEEVRELMSETGDGQLTFFDIREQLKEQMLAKVATQLATAGVEAQPPGRTWRDFLKLNRTAKVEAFPIFVDEYIDQVKSQPTEDEIKAIYEDGITRATNSSSFEPAFVRRPKASAEYVQANLKAWVDLEKVKITDEELKAEYDRRLSLGQLQVPANQPAATTSEEAPATETPMTEAPATETPATTEPATTEPATTEPATTEPATTEPATTEPATTEPATTEPATTEPATTEPATTEPATTEPATTEPATTEPATTEPATTEPATTEPATTEPATTEPATTEPATTEPATTEPATTEPATTEPATTEPGAGSQSRSSLGDARFVSFSQDEQTPPSVVQPPQLGSVGSAVEAPLSAGSATAEPAATAEEAQPPSTGTEASAPAAATTTGQEPPAMRTMSFEEVRDRIAEELATDRARPKMQAALERLRTEIMVPYTTAYRAYVAIRDSGVEGEDNEPPVKPNLKKFAAENNFVYGETGLVDAADLAKTPFGMSFWQQAMNRVSMVLTNPGLPTYTAMESFYFDEAALTSANPEFLQFTFWKTDQRPAYAPTIEEIREEVIDYWRRKEAAKLAMAAAEKIAAKVKGGTETPWNDALNETERALITETDPFTWISRFSAQPDISVVPRLDNVGSEFMEQVFSKSAGSAGTAPNANHRVVYVFNVKELSPTVEDLQQRFNADPLKSGPITLARQDTDVLKVEWFENLLKQYNVSWEIPIEQLMSEE